MDIRQACIRWPVSFVIAMSLCLALTMLWPWFSVRWASTSPAQSKSILVDLYLADALPLAQPSADPAPANRVRPQPPVRRTARSAGPRPNAQAAHAADVPRVAAALDQLPASAERPAAQVQAVNHETASAAVPANAADQVAEAKAGGAEAEDEAKLRARVNTALRHDLQRYFRYPPLARRMGWQGEVWLRFDLHGDGAIATIQVARSSGYDLLDEDAVHTLQQIAHLTTAPPGRLLQGLEIPVIYRLTEG